MSNDIHALSGAYAIDALDDLERAHFERHIAHCSACRLEVDGLREAASMVAVTAATAAPVALRGSVLADIATVRPLPPVVLRAEEARHATRHRFPQLVAAAAAAALIGGGVVTAFHPWDHDTTPASIQASEFDQVVHASDVHRFKSPIIGGGTVSVLRSPSHPYAILEAGDMPALGAGKIYELWLKRGNVWERAGLVPGGHDVTAVLSGDATQATAAAITIERSGGVDSPEGARVASFDFQGA